MTKIIALLPCDYLMVYLIKWPVSGHFHFDTWKFKNIFKKKFNAES